MKNFKLIILVLATVYSTKASFSQSVMLIQNIQTGKEEVLNKGKRIVFEQDNKEGRFKGRITGFEGDDVLINGKKVELSKISALSYSPFSVGAKVGLSVIAVLGSVGFVRSPHLGNRFIFFSPTRYKLLVGTAVIFAMSHKKNILDMSQVEIKVVEKSKLKPEKY